MCITKSDLLSKKKLSSHDVQDSNCSAQFEHFSTLHFSQVILFSSLKEGRHSWHSSLSLHIPHPLHSLSMKFKYHSGMVSINRWSEHTPHCKQNILLFQLTPDTSCNLCTQSTFTHSKAISQKDNKTCIISNHLS
jgi:hypothetical protein